MNSILEKFNKIDAAIMSGRFSDLQSVIDELHSIEIEASAYSTKDLEDISRRAERTAKIINSARIGLKSAQLAHRDICNLGSRFSCYRSNGQRQDVFIGSPRKIISG
ncbi:hypothetical protein HJ526_00860 [Donghicola sp. C2-DW-16]|uniref:Uncharacterized protein n=1 Tax=Donghicola mangrovi TaxID=2729614 RepID=A0ABX2PAI5_9RHOB|nr:hypothetical protein [Donghicola mangrovi]NVO25956.1 hypothetical protein [Donghicola mangrovi]